MNWGDNLSLILLITFTLVYVLSLGTMVAMVVRNETVAEAC